MLVYLDMCCLKRPFDDQTQPRIRLETEAVLSLLAMEGENVQFVRSTALKLENQLNPVRERAARVEQWLSNAELWHPVNHALVRSRVVELMKLGLKSFDSLHVAIAEAVAAGMFATTDDRLISVAKRNVDKIHTRVYSVLECAQKLSK